MPERPLETGWLPDTPEDDNLLRQFVHSQGAVDAAYTGDHGRHDVTDDLFLADSGGPIPFLNQSILRRPLAGLDDPALDAVESFAPAGRPSMLLSVWPTPDLHPRGWSLVGHPAVVVRAPAPLDEELWGDAPGVTVAEATTADDVAVAERILIDGYPMPWASGAPAGTALPPGVRGHGVRVRVASVDGEPVAIGLARVGHGIVNLCGGAALPAARRRGAWKALVRARVLDAPDLPAMAYTSDDSRPGFLRLGFLVLQRFTLWGRGGGFA
jgi:hypothetical protein